MPRTYESQAANLGTVKKSIRQKPVTAPPARVVPPEKGLKAGFARKLFTAPTGAGTLRGRLVGYVPVMADACTPHELKRVGTEMLHAVNEFVPAAKRRLDLQRDKAY